MGRFKLVRYVEDLIKSSHTYQDYEDLHKPVEVKIKKRKEWQSKKIEYWGLLAIIRGKRFKVVLKKVGNGHVMFWSVIPKWKTKKFGNVSMRNLSSGDLEKS